MRSSCESSSPAPPETAAVEAAARLETVPVAAPPAGAAVEEAPGEAMAAPRTRSMSTPFASVDWEAKSKELELVRAFEGVRSSANGVSEVLG